MHCRDRGEASHQLRNHAKLDQVTSLDLAQRMVNRLSLRPLIPQFDRVRGKPDARAGARESTLDNFGESYKRSGANEQHPAGIDRGMAHPLVPLRYPAIQ